MARTSQYLDGKAQNLRSALLFFTSKDKEERLITFLDQIDFWDWEMAELLYSYSNFEERAAAFESTHPGERASAFGLMVNPKKSASVQQDRRWDNWLHVRYGRPAATAMEAPTNSLSETLAVWDALLTEAEKMLVSDKMLVTAKAAGVENVSNKLDKYRKG